MKATLSWLLEYLTFASGAPVLPQILAALEKMGLEVEGVIDWQSILAPFKVVQVMEATKHPNADTLQLCKVYDGQETLSIVCGAPNARAGIKCVLAPIGVTVPGIDLTIKEVKIRGERSCGMLCSENELGISSEHGQIVELMEGATVGDNPASWLGLDDIILDLAVTPNMARTLSIMGMAREIATYCDSAQFQYKKLLTSTHEFDSPITFSLDSHCNFAAGLYIKGLNNKISTQLHIKKRLHAVGISLVSPVVDIVNYCTHEIGQPMHAYDAQKLDGQVLTIRKQANAAGWKALDNKSYQLSSDTLVVSDEQKIVAIAGVIGSKNSACDEETAHVFLEAAVFDRTAVAFSASALGINSQARYLFERGVDQAFCVPALEMAANLIVSVCGGALSKISCTGKNKANDVLSFGMDYLRKISGCNFDVETVLALLQKANITPVQVSDQKIQCKLPSWMSDFESQADIVEEILKINDYDKISAADFQYRNGNVQGDQGYITHRYNQNLRSAFAAVGYCEVVTWSFVKADRASAFATAELLIVKNPISSEMNAMRPSLLPHMLDAISKNASRGVESLAIFEIGSVYDSHGQKTMCAALRSGFNCKRNPIESQRKISVFDLKTDLISAIKLVAFGADFNKIRFLEGAPSYYHPARSAKVLYGDTLLGYFGSPHPSLNVEDTAVMMELDCDAMHSLPSHPRAAIQSKFQSVHRDFAFILPLTVTAQELLDSVRRSLKSMIALVQDMYVFDVYRNPKIGDNNQSIALSITLQAADRTLDEQDMNIISQAVISGVASDLRGILRDA